MANKANVPTEKNEMVEVDGAKYPIAFTSAKINFEGQKKLDEDIQKIYDTYKNVEVSANYVVQAKKERTHINKLVNALNESTKNIVSLAGKELLDFEFHNKEKIKKLKEISAEMKSGIDKYDEKLRQDKHKQNIEFAKKELEKLNLPDTYVEEIEKNYNKRWDNKTYSFTSFQQELGKLIDTFVEHEKQRAQDVTAVIEACNDATSPLDNNYFVKRLDKVPLADVLREIRIHDREVQVAINHSWDENPPIDETPENTDVKNDKIIDKTTGEIVDKVVNITLNMKLKQSQLKAFIPILKNFADKNKIDHSAFEIKKVEK